MLQQPSWKSYAVLTGTLKESVGEDLDGDGQRDLIGQHTTSQTEFEDYNGKSITLQWETL